jgi:hypothetical protein
VEAIDLKYIQDLLKPPNIQSDHVYVNPKIMNNVNQVYRRQINKVVDSILGDIDEKKAHEEQSSSMQVRSVDISIKSKHNNKQYKMSSIIEKLEHQKRGNSVTPLDKTLRRHSPQKYEKKDSRKSFSGLKLKPPPVVPKKPDGYMIEPPQTRTKSTSRRRNYLRAQQAVSKLSNIKVDIGVINKDGQKEGSRNDPNTPNYSEPVIPTVY